MIGNLNNKQKKYGLWAVGILYFVLLFTSSGWLSSLLYLLPFFFFFVGIISLIKPLTILGIASRRAALNCIVLFFFSFLMVAAASLYSSDRKAHEEKLAAENKLKTEHPEIYAKLQKEKAEKEAEQQKQKELVAKQRDKEAEEKAQRQYKDQHPIDLKIINWYKGNFETSLMLNAKLTNTADYPIKDIVIACDMFADSTTPLGSAVQTVYKTIPAKKSIRVNELNMGFVHSQAHKMGCEVIGFLPAGAVIKEFKQDSSKEWQVVRVIGKNLNIVVIKPEAVTEKMIESIIKEVCSDGRWCAVGFFDNAAVTPRKIPLSDQALDAQIASYVFNPYTGHKQLLFSCKIVNDPNRCYK